MTRQTKAFGCYFPQSPRYQRLLADVRAGGQFTAYQAAARCHICHSVAVRYLRHMLDHEAVRIVSWLREDESKRGPWQAVYAAGAGENAPKPKPMLDRVKKYQSKVKADPDAQDRALAVRRARRIRSRTLEEIDPLLAAMTR